MMRRVLFAALVALFPALAYAQQFNRPLMTVGSGSTGSVAPAFAAVAGVTNWLCGIDVSAAGTGLVSPIQVSGVLSSNLFYYGVSAGAAPLIVRFNPCIPASGPNTSISVSTTADASATAVWVSMYGYAAQ